MLREQVLGHFLDAMSRQEIGINNHYYGYSVSRQDLDPSTLRVLDRLVDQVVVTVIEGIVAKHGLKVE